MVYPDSFFTSQKPTDRYNPCLISSQPTVIVVETTIEYLLGYVVFNKTSSELLHKIFGAFQDNCKDAESISSNCLF